MNISRPLTRPVQAPDAPPAPVDRVMALPLRATDFDAGLADLYHDALAGAAGAEVLAGLCRNLGKLLRLPLVLLVRKLDTGAVAIEATSREGPLWVELQRIPERWDSGVTSRGPAGACLRAGAPVRVRADAEGFELWRSAAAGDHVCDILALPFAAPDCTRVLELYFDRPLEPGATNGTVTVGTLADKVGRFMADLQILQRQGLLARALACAGNGAFVTDLEGTIVWSNEAFSALSGYAPEEVRGQNPRLLRSGKQGVRYYRDLWGTIRSGRAWSGEVVDRAKDGRPYVIQQTISPVSQDGRITHYLSIHQDVGRQRRAQTQLELASRLDPASGLLTRAAFESAAARTLAEAAGGKRALALILLSLRGLQRADAAADDELEDFASAIAGQRLRDESPELAGVYGPCEYALLLDGESLARQSLEQRLASMAERLNEPMPLPGEAVCADVHFGAALFPHEGATLQELIVKADRRLADEPYRRACRRASPEKEQ